MSASVLAQLREWLTITQTAHELTKGLSERVDEPAVLRLALDGHLLLSLFLPVPITVTGYGEAAPADLSFNRTPFRRSIEGLCDLRMEDRAKIEVEHQYQRLAFGLYVPRPAVLGVSVEQDGFTFKLPPDKGETGLSTRAESELPQGSVLCVRREALDAFIEEHRPPTDLAVVSVERPLGSKERTTLLLMIDALADAARIDISRASKAGGVIAAMMDKRGHAISPHAIAGHLRRLRKMLTGTEAEGEDGKEP